MPTPLSPSDTKSRIEQAAEAIIRADGIAALTMRRLADEASVALKTPYNLFGSKTGVMTALLDRVTLRLMADLTASGEALSLPDLVLALDRLARFYQADEPYYRGIFWEIMKSDHPEARGQAHDNIIALITGFVQGAEGSGALKANANVVLLGQQLALNLLANLGLWAGGHMSIEDTATQTKAVWIMLLLEAAAEGQIPDLRKLLSVVQARAAEVLSGNP